MPEVKDSRGGINVIRKAVEVQSPVEKIEMSKRGKPPILKVDLKDKSVMVAKRKYKLKNPLKIDKDAMSKKWEDKGKGVAKKWAAGATAGVGVVAVAKTLGSLKTIGEEAYEEQEIEVVGESERVQKNEIKTYLYYGHVSMVDVNDERVSQIMEKFGTNWAFVPNTEEELAQRLQGSSINANIDTKTYEEIKRKRKNQMERELGISFDPLKSNYVDYSYEELAGNSNLILKFLERAKEIGERLNGESSITDEVIEFYEEASEGVENSQATEGVKLMEDFFQNDEVVRVIGKNLDLASKMEVFGDERLDDQDMFAYSLAMGDLVEAGAVENDWMTALTATKTEDPYLSSMISISKTLDLGDASQSMFVMGIVMVHFFRKAKITLKNLAGKSTNK